MSISVSGLFNPGVFPEIAAIHLSFQGHLPVSDIGSAATGIYRFFFWEIDFLITFAPGKNQYNILI
jgi:hypothetical protein